MSVRQFSHTAKGHYVDTIEEKTVQTERNAAVLIGLHG
jgi:hypothetical protein